MTTAATIPPERLPALLAAMPKAELHIHIEGSLEPELIFALAQRNGVAIPYASVEDLRRAYAFTNLQSFLDIYYAGASVLLKEQDFYDMAWAYLQRAAADHVLRAEIFFDPQTHTARGVAMETVITGLHRACRDAKRIGVDAWSALDVLKVERIDHGVQSTQDPALMKRLAQDRIPLTVCPLSNLKLCVFPSLAQHNLRELLDAGLCATVNSDDPAYFGGYLNENFLQTFAATGLDAQHAYRLARNSFEGSFADDSAKQGYIERLDAAFAAA